jgi:ABC-type nickel/cobalt efflux system permease component RcnA
VAHPLGNFTVNAAAAITVSPGTLRVDYALDLAEIPTFQELPRIDLDEDEQAEDGELTVWSSRRAVDLLDGLEISLDGRAIPLTVTGARASLAPGQGGLQVLRLDAVFSGLVPEKGSLRVVDRNDPGRLGWREIVAVGSSGVAVTGSSVPAQSSSDHLRAYPDDFLASPPGIREARFTFGPGTQVGTGEGFTPGASTSEGSSTLTRLVGSRSLNAPLVLLALLVAFGVGALHALAPGHGKTVTAAYIAGGSARTRDAVRVGVAVAVMHTATVILLGVILVVVAREFPAERLYPWLGIVAGGAALALGTGLLLNRSRHELAHRGGHDHAHHSTRTVTRPGLAALALSGGLLPSPTAVVILLASFTLDRAVFGLGLVMSFGAGLALSLIAVGLFTMRARDAALRRLPARVTNAVPIAGAGAIAVVGALIAARAVAQL